MPFTASELASIANSALKFYIDKGKLHDQSIQNKPLVGIMEGKAKSFPGGDGNLSFAVKGVYGAGGVNDGFAGYTHDDTVGFYTPENVMRGEAPWREHHMGLTMTHTELKMDGISVTDTNGTGTSQHSNREKTVLVEMLDTKLADFAEMRNRTLNSLLWGDGTGDAKALAGLQSIIVDNPTAGTVMGIDASLAANWWWRNRARTAAHQAATTNAVDGPVTSSPANGGALFEVLQFEDRQLRRYGGNWDTCLAGSDFIAALEREMKANGYYTQTGFTGGGDGAIGEVTFKGKAFRYDPTLDDLGLSKRAYMFPSSDICLYKMTDEWNKQHNPSRPQDRFVLYRSVTCTGQVIAKRRNSALVIDIA